MRQIASPSMVAVDGTVAGRPAMVIVSMMAKGNTEVVLEHSSWRLGRQCAERVSHGVGFGLQGVGQLLADDSAHVRLVRVQVVQTVVEGFGHARRENHCVISSQGVRKFREQPAAVSPMFGRADDIGVEDVSEQLPAGI